MFSNSGVKCGGCSINRRIVIKVADLVSLVLYTPNRSFQQASRSSLLDSNELIFMGVWGNWSVGYILFTETADVTSATPLLYAIRYLRQGYRSFIWSTVPCEVWFCLLLDHFLATFSPFLRLLIILQIYKVQPYFRTFVPTGSSLKISLLQVSPSLTFFLLWKVLFDLWIGKIPRRRERLPTLVFWPGEFHGLHAESDMTEQLSLSFIYSGPP